MRICLISREFPPDTGWGGIATFVHDLALGLSEIGHEVEVVALAADNLTRVVEYEGVRVHRVSSGSRLEDLQRLLTVMPYSHSLLKQLWSLWERFLVIHEEKPFDVVEVPEMFGEGHLVAISKAAPLVVRLYTPHFKFIEEKLHNITAAFDHQFIALLERTTMLLADVVTSPSEDLRDYVCENIGYPPEKVVIVRDPVNTSKFCPEGSRALPNDGRLTVLFAGRLEARKGIYFLMEAIPKVVSVFPNVRFVIVGRDTNTGAGKKSVLAQLKRLLKQSGCTAYVEFISAVPNSEMPAIFRSADICVVPSLYDNAPFTCLEALSTGKPVIGTLAGGMKEYIVHGYSGLVVAPADAEALAQALLDLLMDNNKRLSFGQFARQHVLANFDRKEIARQSVQLYELAKANFASSKQYAFYRHEQDSLLPSTVRLAAAYDKMLYDMLYAYSWRFRLTHWAHMLKDRPRLTAAKAITYLGRPIVKLFGCNSTLPVLDQLEKKIQTKYATKNGEKATVTRR